MRLLFLLFISYTFLSAGGGVLEINWPKANNIQQKSTTPYPSVLTEGIKEVRLPVYLSSAYIYDKSMVVVADEFFYSISFDLEGAIILFEGDRTFQEKVSPSNPEFQKIMQKSKPVNFSVSEEIRLADFNRHGANYTISVECTKPKRDKRCTEETFIRNLYAGIRMVGGKR